MTLLLALVASLALVRVGGGWTGRDTTVIESGAGRSQTIPAVKVSQSGSKTYKQRTHLAMWLGPPQR